MHVHETESVFACPQDQPTGTPKSVSSHNATYSRGKPCGHKFQTQKFVFLHAASENNSLPNHAGREFWTRCLHPQTTTEADPALMETVRKHGKQGVRCQSTFVGDIATKKTCNHLKVLGPFRNDNPTVSKFLH